LRTGQGRVKLLKELPDSVLVRKVADFDDRNAFEELVKRHQRTVFAVIYRVLGSRTKEVEDVAQEVFLALYRNIANFKAESKFSTWLYRIAYNHACSAIRKYSTNKEKLLANSLQREDGTTIDIEQKDSKDPSDTILAEQVWDIVDEMPVQMKTILELFYSQEKSYDEIAEILTVPLGTVKTQLHRARAELRMRLMEPELAGSKK
jgi:RNA polymerase sigma-70 factor (ECF subfamily)